MTVSAVGFRSERGPVLIALMVTTAIVAIEATIVATAIPSIVGDLGGFTAFPWLFSVYLLAAAVSVPVYSKISDLRGRKPVLLFGIGLFLLGSLLCGFAWSMPALIAFRAVQGLGAGAVQPMAVTIVGDLYTVAERARVQGYIASVWAAGSVLGPTLGGVFSEFTSWRWIFFVNIPIGIVAAWLLSAHFKEEVARRRHRIDYLGSTLLAGGLGLLILTALEGGQAWAWSSPQSIGSFAISGALLTIFVFVERKAVDPVLPLEILSRRLIIATTLTALGVGAILMGLTSYVPTFLEGAIGVSPLTSGIALGALMLGWPLSTAIAGRLYLRIGFKRTALVGMMLIVSGTSVIAATAVERSVFLSASGCFVVGLGLGLVATPSLIAAQKSVPWSERGVVTGTTMFARSVGSAVGVAVFGAIANTFTSNASLGEPNTMAVQTASQGVFIAVTVVAVATAVAVAAMPPGRGYEAFDDGVVQNA
jgi:EmrB/QacA subfamily drug resistance transporter